MSKYAIIGGQYQSYFYGFASSLHAAKLLATRNEEYWDNWQGWHTPNIYNSEDVEPIVNFYGDGYAPKPDAIPCAVRPQNSKKWIDPNSDF